VGKASSRIIARRLELKELISLLSHEHQDQRKRLADIADVLAKKNYPRVAHLVSEFDNASIQHIVDEENVLLKLFIDAYGRKGADDAIKVFQQHRTMHKLADAISKHALTNPEDLGSMQSDFDKLVRSHFEAEEKRIFPWALKTQSGLEASKRIGMNG
jgi:hemerythrin-like domain-containing protein